MFRRCDRCRREREETSADRMSNRTFEDWFVLEFPGRIANVTDRKELCAACMESLRDFCQPLPQAARAA